MSSDIKSLEECLVYSLGASSIVVRNLCDNPVNIKAIEVEYYIYISRSTAISSNEKVELGHLRKKVVERISVEQEVTPKSSINIYFGALKNIEAVYAIVEVGEKEYKVKMMPMQSQ